MEGRFFQSEGEVLDEGKPSFERKANWEGFD